MIMERLAKAIKDSGKSRYRIAKDTGIDNSVLFRIVNGGSCNVQTLEVLCEYLGLELVEKKRKKAKKPLLKGTREKRQGQG
jgi:ribosome-binding protein aMBF1 (putative translation factor)